jgi:hypothetical protein
MASPVSKSTGTNRTQSGTPSPDSTRRCCFHAWGPGYDGGAKGLGKLRIHVGTKTPVRIRGNQSQTNFVREHMGWWIDQACSARHSATRTAVLSGSGMVCSSLVPQVCAPAAAAIPWRAWIFFGGSQ